MSIFGILFAVIGLSFLIFIHELGHFFMAKKAGMKIEVFSIGMGKPMFSWKQNGVKWQVCYLLFGGYVRIAGMEGEKGKEPYQIRGGFYSKKPIYRLLVAGAGPFVNIVFSLFFFAIVYFSGGQMRPFEQYTALVGSVDKGSQIHEAGIVPGDKIVSFDNKAYGGFRDVIMQGMLKNKKGVDVVFDRDGHEVLSTNALLYSPERDSVSSSFPPEWRSMGILSSASYVFADDYLEGKEKFAPLYGSGIEKGDRIIYVDGNIIYSVAHLSEIINKDIALVTVERDGVKVHLQVPRVLLGDLNLSNDQRDEFIDSKREMNLEGAISSTHFIPYLVSEGLYVQDELSLIEEESFSQKESILKRGDKILAVSGINVSSSEDFYNAISERKCLVMVSNQKMGKVTWKEGDKVFSSGLDKAIIAQMEAKIGAESTPNISTYRFLKPSKPISYKEYLEAANPMLLKQQEEVLGAERYKQLMATKTLFSGLLIKDMKVEYNPGPFTLASNVVDDMLFSLKGLFSGSISAKHMSGPIGMVKIVHDESKRSPLTGIYWLGMISLNLGLMNLLPVPILDGGHICFTLYEMITKKRIKAKTMQIMMMPFIVLMIFFFAYVTFYDVIKVFS